MRLLVYILAPLAAQSMPDGHLRAALHVHSSFSTGTHTVMELAHQAERAGIDVLVLNDHFKDEIAYGVPFFRQAFAAKIRVPSLIPSDLPTFIEAAREAEAATGVMVLPGVELTPYYYWEGHPLSRNLTLRSAGRQLLVVFPHGPDGERLSSALFNTSSSAGRRFSMLLLWPFVPLIWAVRRILRPRTVVRRTAFFLVKKTAPSPIAWLIAAGALGVLLMSWPYTVPKWSPYDINAGTAPYKEAVELASDAGALTFWAHPEASTKQRHPRYPATFRSDEYSHFVTDIDGAHGFASLYEGYRKTAAPGGNWDRSLLDYCRGKRLNPMWTIGEIDYHEWGEAGGKLLGNVETILLVREHSHIGVLDALERGSYYAVRHDSESRLILDEFTISSGPEHAYAGAQMASSGERQVQVRVHRDGIPVAPVELTIIRNGDIVEQRTLEIRKESTTLVWEDNTRLDGPSYYRVIIKGRYPEMLFANPIFVMPSEEAS